MTQARRGGGRRQVQASGEEKEASGGGIRVGEAGCWRAHVLAVARALLRMVSRLTEIALLSDYIKQVCVFM